MYTNILTRKVIKRLAAHICDIDFKTVPMKMVVEVLEMLMTKTSFSLEIAISSNCRGLHWVCLLSLHLPTSSLLSTKQPTSTTTQPTLCIIKIYVVVRDIYIYIYLFIYIYNIFCQTGQGKKFNAVLFIYDTEACTSCYHVSSNSSSYALFKVHSNYQTTRKIQ